jgi:hypothetical protein
MYILKEGKLTPTNKTPENDLIYYLMYKTSTTCFFHERDYHEFFVRLILLFPEVDIAGSIFMDNMIINKENDKHNYHLSTQDLQNFLGSVGDLSLGRINRKSWLKFINHKRRAIFDLNYEGWIINGIEDKVVKVTKKDIKHSEFLANLLMSELDLKKIRTFHRKNKSKILKLWNLYQYPADFDYNALTEDQKDILHKYLVRYDTEDFLDEEMEEKLIYLSWLRKNGHLKVGKNKIQVLFCYTPHVEITEENFGMDTPTIFKKFRLKNLEIFLEPNLGTCPYIIENEEYNQVKPI